jgi:hypothetical protein
MQTRHRKSVWAVLLALLVTATGLAVTPAPAGAIAFSDVPSDHDFWPEINAMSNRGVINGYDDGTFRPTAPVTRQAMAAFLWRV